MRPPGRDPWPRWWPRGPFDPSIDILQAYVEEFASREPPAIGSTQYLTDHGVGHVRRVLALAEQLVSDKFVTSSMTDGEKATLYAAILAHDLGLFMLDPSETDVEAIRARHAALSAKWLLENAADCALDDDFARVLASIVGAHRRTGQLAEVDQYTHISSPAWADLRPRFLTALLRIADALDIGQSRAPIVFYRHFDAAFPLASVEHWLGYDQVENATLDLNYRQIVLHVKHQADPRDARVRRVYRALQTEFDALDSDWMRWMSGVDLAIVFCHRGKIIAPGSIFAAQLDDSVNGGDR